jgi:hypothetical protein
LEYLKRLRKARVGHYWAFEKKVRIKELTVLVISKAQLLVEYHQRIDKEPAVFRDSYNLTFSENLRTMVRYIQTKYLIFVKHDYRP